MAAVIWVPALVLLWFYKIGSTDEGGYHYQALYLAKGHMPVLEFFTSHTIWAYLPYAAVIKALSPSLESARVFSVASIIATVAMVTALARKHYGWEAAAYAFVMAAFSWIWLAQNIQIRHSAPANLGLVSAFFVLFYLQPRALLRIFLAGVAIGIAVNSRVVLLPLAVSFPFVAYYFRRTAAAEVRLPKFVAAFVLGALIPSLPSLYILAADHQAFFFDYLLARLSWTEGLAETRTLWEGAIAFAETRTRPVAKFFFERITFGNAVTLIPVLASLAAILFQKQSERFARLRALVRQPLLLAAAAMMVGIYLSYIFADIFPTIYLHHWIPFLILLVLGFYARAAELMSSRTFHWAIRLPLLMGLVLLVADFGSRTAVSTVLRGDPYLKRPLEISRVACWIDRNMARDAVVMNYLGAVVAASGRRLPEGYEQGVGILGFFWMQSFPEKLADRYKIMTIKQYLAKLKSGKIQVVIDDGLVRKKLTQAKMVRIQRLIDEHYYPVAGASETGPYRIMAHKSLDPAALTPYTPAPWFRKGKEGRVGRYLEQGDYAAAVREVLGDVATSLATLPADLAGSFHRLIGAGYEQRCGPTDALWRREGAVALSDDG